MKKEITLRQKLVPFFLMASILPVLAMGIISLIRLGTNMQQSIDMQVEGNLDKADQVLDIILDKYATILYDLCTDDSLVEIVEKMDAGEADTEVSVNQLRRELSHICNRNEGVLGITLQTAKGKTIFYDRVASSSTSTSWADEIRVPDVQKGEDYYGITQPVKRGDDDIYMIQIARNIIDYRNIHKNLGTVVISIDEEVIRKALEIGEGKKICLFQDGILLSAADPSLIGKDIREVNTQNELAVSRENSRTGWTIYYYHSLEVYNQMVMEQALIWIAIGIAIVAALMGILYKMTRPILHSMDTVVEAMEVVETGNFDLRIEPDDSMAVEIKKIYSGFNEMVERIDGLMGQVRQAVVEQKNAELSALEAQIDPHFLYNTLDTINWKAIEKEDYEISEMVGALADILRYTVKNAGAETTVEQELYWLEEYMLLQGAKLGKQLSSVVDVPDDLKGCRLHKLLLQPFVENAIKHGFYKKEVPCILKISMKKIEGQLHIIIKDNGIGMSPAKIAELNRTLEEGKEHLGVANVKKRLKLYYGDEAEVYFESRQDRYTKVHLFIPA